MPLAPYTGAWGRSQAFHLLRRTTFGPKRSDVTQVVSAGMAAAVAEILTAPPSSIASPPLNDYSYNGTSPDANVPYGSTWVNAPYDSVLSGLRLNSFRYWWFGQMINEGRSIHQKMIMFLHNQTPTGLGSIVNNHIHCYEHYKLLHIHAMGNFKTFIREVTLDRAMLVYLDGEENTNTAPNENYARELQELFTVGKDLPVYYTQSDVETAAKVLTGWRINGSTANANGGPFEVYLSASKHDTSNKTFSSFYNNTVITGQSGQAGASAELDALMNMIFNQNEVANYIVRKLYRYFVYYKIDAAIEANIIQPLATTFRTNNYNILPVLQELFTSQHFYDMNQNGCIIKSPIEYFVSIAKSTNMLFPAASDTYNIYRGWRQLYVYANDCQMQIGNPTNVAGWVPWREAPNYHELWITADTLRTRKKFVDAVGGNGLYGGTVKIDVLAFTASLTAPGDPNIVIDELFELLHPIAPDAALRLTLKQNILLSNQVDDYYWTTAWNNYIANPTTANTNTVKNRLRDLYIAILNIAEAHLA